MDRRTFVKTATIGAGAAALTGCDSGDSTAQPGKGPAVLRKKRELKLVTTWPKNLPGLGMAPERIAKNVEEATEGSLKIRVFAAGELVGALDAFDAVSTGSADMYHGAEYYWQGKSQAFNFFTSVPFGLTANEHMAWIYYGGGQALYFASQGTGRLLRPVSVGVLRFLVVSGTGAAALTFGWPLEAVFAGVSAGLVVTGVGLALCLLGPDWRPREVN